MEAYSMDLRNRVWDALQNRDESGETLTEIAERFAVSRQWIYLLLRHWDKRQTLEPKPHAGGQPRKVRGELEEKLKEAFAKGSDATLEEIRDRLGITSSLMCIWRALKRLKITRKKRLCVPKSKMILK
jgi:transposase